MVVGLRITNRNIAKAPNYKNYFDLFVGLGLGLQQAGAVECKWAIEPDTAAAATFQLNNPDTAVFVGSHTEMMNKISKVIFERLR